MSDNIFTPAAKVVGDKVGDMTKTVVDKAQEVVTKMYGAAQSTGASASVNTNEENQLVLFLGLCEDAKRKGRTIPVQELSLLKKVKDKVVFLQKWRQDCDAIDWQRSMSLAIKEYASKGILTTAIVATNIYNKPKSDLAQTIQWSVSIGLLLFVLLKK